MKSYRWLNILLAGLLAAGAVLFAFANVFLTPYFFNVHPKGPTPGLVFAMAGTAAALALAIAIVWPGLQASLIRVLLATAFIYLVSKPLAVPYTYWLSTLPLVPTAKYWVYRGPGGATLGLLPTIAAVVVGGRYLFGLSLREQWNGRMHFALRDLVYGAGSAILMCAFLIGGAAVTGDGRVAWEPDWAQNSVNLFSNLYEEILTRGMLLQICRREGGNRFAILWTGLVFGSMHNFGWPILAMAIGGWFLAWVILRAGSLWAGYVAHQVIDVVMDSCLH